MTTLEISRKAAAESPDGLEVAAKASIQNVLRNDLVDAGIDWIVPEPTPIKNAKASAYAHAVRAAKKWKAIRKVRKWL